MTPRTALLVRRSPLSMGARKYQIQKSKSAQPRYTVWMTMMSMPVAPVRAGTLRRKILGRHGTLFVKLQKFPETGCRARRCCAESARAREKSSLARHRGMLQLGRSNPTTLLIN